MKLTPHLLCLALVLNTARVLASQVGTDAGRGGTLPPLYKDDISYATPEQGITYHETPELRGRVTDYAIDGLITWLEQLGPNGSAVGLVNFQTGHIIGYSTGNLLVPGYTSVRTWNPYATGGFTLPRPLLPAGNYRLVTQGSYLGYAHAYGRVSFRVEPPLSRAASPGDATVTIASPTSTQKFRSASEVTLRGQADGEEVDGVRLAVGRFDASGQPSEIYNWDAQSWETATNRTEYRQSSVISGIASWSAQLPAGGFGNGRYRATAYAVRSTVVFAYGSVDFEIDDAPPTTGTTPPQTLGVVAFESPTHGAASTSTPVLRGRIDTAGVQSIVSALEHLDANGRPDGLVNWTNGSLAPYSEAGLNTPGVLHALAWNGLTGTYTLPSPNLPAGTYTVHSFARQGQVALAMGSVSFRIEPSGSIPGSPGGLVLTPPGGDPDPGTDPGGTDPTPVAVVKGAYTGPIALAEGEPSRGQIDLAVAASGRFSGKVCFAGIVTAPVGGTLSDLQETVVPIKVRSGGASTLRLTPDFASREIAATYEDADGSQWVARLRLATYSARTHPAPHVGSCNAVSRLETPADDRPAPTGHAYARLRFTPDGRFTAAGKLGDGTPFALGGWVIESESGADEFSGVAAVRSPRDGAGSLLALHGGTIDRADAAAPLACNFAAEWTRAASAKRAEFPAGFALSLHCTGGEYRPPARGATALPLVSYDIVLDGATGIAAVTHAAQLGANHAFTVTAPGADRLTVKIAPATGLVTGSFLDTATGAKCSLEGLVAPDTGEVLGFFRSATASGRLEIAAGE